MVSRAIKTTVVVVLMALVGASSASATQRYASPTGTATIGTGCPQITPCSLGNAGSLANGNPGDELVLAGGDYVLGGSTMLITAAIEMYGPGPSDPARLLGTGGSVLQVTDPNATVRDLEVVNSAGTVSAILVQFGTLERVVARNSSGPGCLVQNATIKSSVCTSAAAGVAAITFNENSGSFSNTLRNVTAIGTGSARALDVFTSGSANVDFDIKSSILRSSTTDVVASNATAGATVVSATHTNYSTSAGNATNLTPPSDPTMQQSAPLFVDAPSGNYHQDPSSPTVNAGAVDAQSSSTDFEGDARTVDSVPDIGADEVHAPSITSPIDGSFIGDNTPRVEGTTKDGASVELLVDGATPICSTFATAGNYFCDSPQLSDGVHSFSATDTFESNGSLITTVTATVDTTAPVISIASPSSTTTTQPASAVFTITELHPGGTQCRVDAGAFAECASGVAIGALAPGAHSFEVRHTDVAGNIGVSRVSFTLGQTTGAPQTRIVKKPKKATKTRRATFKFSSTPAGAKFMCKLDKGKFKRCSAKFSVKVKPGKHTLQVYAIDATGARDRSAAIYKWKVLKG